MGKLRRHHRSIFHRSLVSAEYICDARLSPPFPSHSRSINVIVIDLSFRRRNSTTANKRGPFARTRDYSGRAHRETARGGAWEGWNEEGGGGGGSALNLNTN